MPAPFAIPPPQHISGQRGPRSERRQSHVRSEYRKVVASCKTHGKDDNVAGEYLVEGHVPDRVENAGTQASAIMSHSCKHAVPPGTDGLRPAGASIISGRSL